VIRLAWMLFVGSVASACTVSQLSDFKKEEAAKDYTAIANKTIDAGCFVEHPTDECAQAAEIQGRACLTLARQEAAPNAACPPATDTARRHLQCAAQDFGVAVKSASFSTGDKADFTEMRARALYCGATLMTRTQGLPDAREAAQELDTLPSTPQRDQLSAAASLYVANSETLSAAERCAAAQAAVARASRGLQNNPSGDIQQGLTDTRTHAESVASHLPNCRTL
jgi:hypothetical protein